MRIREARPGDLDAVGTVHERSVRQVASEAYSAAVVEAWASHSDDDSDDGPADTPSDEGATNDHDGEDEGASSVDTDEEMDGAQPDDGRLFVAEATDAEDDQTGSIAGFGDVRVEPPEYLEEPADGGVRAVYVDPDYVGEGVGSALLERLEATAREWGLDSLGLHSSVNARGFYEHHGYEVVTELTFEFGGEVEGPAVEMRKEL